MEVSVIQQVVPFNPDKQPHAAPIMPRSQEPRAPEKATRRGQYQNPTKVISPGVQVPDLRTESEMVAESLLALHIIPGGLASAETHCVIDASDITVDGLGPVSESAAASLLTLCIVSTSVTPSGASDCSALAGFSPESAAASLLPFESCPAAHPQLPPRKPLTAHQWQIAHLNGRSNFSYHLYRVNPSYHLGSLSQLISGIFFHESAAASLLTVRIVSSRTRDSALAVKILPNPSSRLPMLRERLNTIKQTKWVGSVLTQDSPLSSIRTRDSMLR
jgi:hypothetical protein